MKGIRDVMEAISAGDMNMLVGAGGASLPDLNSFFTAMSGLQKMLGGFIGGYSATEKIMDDIDEYYRVTLYRGVHDLAVVRFNENQLNRFKDFKTEKGSRFRDSLRTENLDYFSAKIYDKKNK